MYKTIYRLMYQVKDGTSVPIGYTWVNKEEDFKTFDAAMTAFIRIRKTKRWYRNPSLHEIVRIK